jgi:hypothetical protein
VELHVVSQQSGHADTSITASLYAHVPEDQPADAAKVRTAYLFGTGA